MKNPGYAKTLRKIAAEGRDGFYQGEIAEAIVSASSARGGTMTLEDLASYEVRVGKPLEGNYRGFTILTSAPSSSGGIALILNKYPDLTNKEVKRCLLKSARPLNYPKSYQGWGFFHIPECLDGRCGSH